MGLSPRKPGRDSLIRSHLTCPPDGVHSSSGAILTLSGHSPARNPASQQPPAVSRCAILPVANWRHSAVKRREFISLLGGSTVAWPLAARSQQPDRVRRISVLMAFAESDPGAQSWVAAFREELGKLRGTEGRNIEINTRWA